MPWISQPRGVGTDSNELLYAQGQSYDRVSEIIQNYSQSKFAQLIKNLKAIINEPPFKAITDIISEIEDLRTWETDSYGCPAPSYGTVKKAEDWIIRLYFQIAFQDWISPNVTSGPEGEVVFEWWYGVKKLTIYISNQNVEYIQVWGTDIYEDMSDGNAESIDACRKLWMWLRS